MGRNTIAKKAAVVKGKSVNLYRMGVLGCTDFNLRLGVSIAIGLTVTAIGYIHFRRECPKEIPLY